MNTLDQHWSGPVKIGQHWSALASTSQDWSYLGRTNHDRSYLVKIGQNQWPSFTKVLLVFNRFRFRNLEKAPDVLSRKKISQNLRLSNFWTAFYFSIANQNLKIFLEFFFKFF